MNNPRKTKMSEIKTISWGNKEIPVVREVDVLVAGGGYAGFGAAMCAARNGAKVILVDGDFGY